MNNQYLGFGSIRIKNTLTFILLLGNITLLPSNFQSIRYICLECVEKNLSIIEQVSFLEQVLHTSNHAQLSLMQEHHCIYVCT